MSVRSFLALLLLSLATPALAEAPPSEPEPPPVRSKWAASLYGFVELDSIWDSSQSFNDLAGNSNIARPGTYAADHGRMTFGARNSRLGFKLAAPDFHGMHASAIAEMDFLGNQPPNAAEAAYFASPAFRIRHMALKLETAPVVITVGQYWELFGWQANFHPNTVEIQGVPGQVYSRAPQIRLARVFQSPVVGLEVAIAAVRPPQRDGAAPDGQGGLRLFFPFWKGLRTAGATGTAIDALGIGVSGLVRRFNLPEFSAKPVASVSTVGWGVSADALIPIIPVRNGRRGNTLTFTGNYVRGAGIADQFTGLTGGLTFPNLPNPTGASPAPTYSPDVDNGLVTFDSSGGLHAIGWQSILVGLQYYLPPSGNLWVSGNFSQMSSNNAGTYGTPATKVFTWSRWINGNLFWDVTPAVRFGLEYAYYKQRYADGVAAHDHRVQLSGFYLF
jgi:hypothetical protein